MFNNSTESYLPSFIKKEFEYLASILFILVKLHVKLISITKGLKVRLFLTEKATINSIMLKKETVKACSLSSNILSIP